MKAKTVSAVSDEMEKRDEFSGVFFCLFVVSCFCFLLRRNISQNVGLIQSAAVNE